MNNQWFPNVTDLSVLFHNWGSTDLFPSVVDFCKVTKLSLRFDFFTLPSQRVLDCLVHLLKQTSNFHSLSVDRQSSDSTEQLLIAKNIYSVILPQLDRSKLRQLTIPVGNLDDVEMLLDRSRELSSITFTRWIKSIRIEQIVKHTKTLIDDCSIWESEGSVSLWTGKQLEIPN